MKSRISASTYLECSALTGFGIQTAWETIIRQVFLLDDETTDQTSTPKKKSRETRRSFLSLFL